jgi:adenosylmethionine-8-amino-7-oxononanoate aminotransferase
VARRALEKGLILRADPDWIAVAPPLTITRQEADILFDTLSESLREEIAELSRQGL